MFTLWPLEDSTVIFKLILEVDILSISWEIAFVQMLQNPLMMSQHWFREWLGAVRQQAITWANVDPYMCQHMASPGHNELNLDPETNSFFFFNSNLSFSMLTSWKSGAGFDQNDRMYEFYQNESFFRNVEFILCLLSIVFHGGFMNTEFKLKNVYCHTITTVKSLI